MEQEQRQNKHRMMNTIPLPCPSRIGTSTTLDYVPTKGPVPRPVAKAATRHPIRSPYVTGNMQKTSERLSFHAGTYNVCLAYYMQCFSKPHIRQISSCLKYGASADEWQILGKL